MGLAFYIIWRDLKQAADKQSETQNHGSPETQYQLRVVASNGDSSLTEGQSLPLHGETWLGRALDNTIVLNDDAASSRHARIRREHGVWWLEDLGSRNGTMLNDLPLSRPASLVDGDIIEIGSVRLRLEPEQYVS